MKTILVLTDFSRNAVRAAKSAAWLGEELHVGIYLWNCRPMIPVAPAYLGGAGLGGSFAGSATSTELLQDAATELEDYISATDEGYRPQVIIGYDEGDFSELLRKVLHDKPVEMIVMGATTGHSGGNIFGSNHTFRVIETAKCPVLVIPPHKTLNELRKIIFASCFDQGELGALEYLTSLSNKLGASVEIVHVKTDDEKDNQSSQKEAIFRQQLDALKITAPQRSVGGRDLVGRLNRIATHTGADMLAMGHHQYHFIRRLFTESVSRHTIARQQVPVLIFPLGWNVK